MEGMEGIRRQRVVRHKMADHRAKFHAHGTPSTREGDRREVCAICQDVPTAPCTVPCGNNHVFCLACLQGLVQHANHERHFPCPLCRKRVGIPEGGLAALQNKVLAGRSENRRRSQGQAPRRMRLPLRNPDDDLPLGSVDRDEQRQILEDVQQQMRVRKPQGLGRSSARRGRVLFDESGRMSSILRSSADLLPTASVYAEHADLDALFGYSGPRYDGNVMGVSRVTSPPNSSRLPFHSSSGGGGAAANRGDSNNDNLDMGVVMQVIAEMDGHRF